MPRGSGEPDDRRVSHICSRYPGLVEVAFNFALAAAGGAVRLHRRREVPDRRRKVPVCIPRVPASGLRTRAGEGAMMAPASWATALRTKHAAAGAAPRRTRGMALAAPIVMPIGLELDRTRRAPGTSHAAAACG